MTCFLYVLLIAGISVEDVYSIQLETASGMEIMEEVYQRHQQFPFIYEEQSMVTEDRNGLRNTRLAKRYSRVEEDGTVKFLLIFEYPEEVKGVALLAIRNPDNQTKKYIYLPAYGEQLFENSGDGSNENFLGTDFTVENLTGEILSDHMYARADDTEIEGTSFVVVDVYKSDDTQMQERLRRHYIRQDNLFITLSEHFDKHGRLSRVQTHHDLKEVDTDMWRANMILMEDKKEQHQSLVKISRRVFSHDYVPQEIFTENWLYENFPYVETKDESDEGEVIIEQVEIE